MTRTLTALSVLLTLAACGPPFIERGTRIFSQQCTANHIGCTALD